MFWFAWLTAARQVPANPAFLGIIARGESAIRDYFAKYYIGTTELVFSRPEEHSTSGPFVAPQQLLSKRDAINASAYTATITCDAQIMTTGKDSQGIVKIVKKHRWTKAQMLEYLEESFGLDAAIHGMTEANSSSLDIAT
jgi:hypothetical protein